MIEEHFENLDDPHTGHLKAHHFEVFKDIIKITKAKTILELGFCVGHSSIMWLETDPEVSVVSTDIEVRQGSIDYINQHWGSRFKFLNLNHSLINRQFDVGQFDLIFIDGNHERGPASSDMEASMKLKPTYIVLDDTSHSAHLYLREFARNYGWREVKHYENHWGQTLYEVGK